MIGICLEYSHTLWSTRCTKVNSSDTIRESTYRQRLIQFYNELKDDPSPIGVSSSFYFSDPFTTSTSRTNQLYNFGKQKSIKQSTQQKFAQPKSGKILSYVHHKFKLQKRPKNSSRRKSCCIHLRYISVPTKSQAEIIFNQKLIYSLTYSSLFGL